MTRHGGTAGTLPAREPKDPDLDALASVVKASGDGLVVLDRRLQCVSACPTACTMLGYGVEELRGRDLVTVTQNRGPVVSTRPDFEQGWRRDRLAAVFAGKPGRWETVVHRPDGSRLDIECIATRLEVDRGELMAVVLRDDSERRRQAREAAALAQAAASAAVSDSIDATLQALAESALRGTRALGASVVLDDKGDSAWIGAAGMPDGYADSLRAAIRAGTHTDHYELLAAAQRIFVERDARRRVEGDPRYARLAEVLRSIPWQSRVLAPLVYQDAVVGTLCAIYHEDELPLVGELVFLTALADQAALAAMSARLMTAVRDKAALEERQRLSRKLHDSVSQALYGIALGARTARDLADHDPARVVEPIEYVLRLAEAGLSEMRALIFELRPESLETEGLVAALDKQVEALRARHGIAARTTAGEEPDPPFEIKQALYRIAQEALQNTVRHARARRVDVRLAVQEGAMFLTIEDDGVGFDPAKTLPGHLGLRSMRERALGVGGSLEVVSVPSQGTRILVSVPMPSQAQG